MTDDALVEESFEIAWNTFEATGELRDRESAATFLSNKIITMVRRGEKRRLLLSNRAIDLYRQRDPNVIYLA
jgi:hypothetical protein